MLNSFHESLGKTELVHHSNCEAKRKSLGRVTEKSHVNFFKKHIPLAHLPIAIMP